MSAPNEIVAPIQPLYERLGLHQPKLVEATRTVTIRKIKHVHPETGATSMWFNAADLVELLDREFETTDSQHVAKLSDILRQMAGLA